MSKVWLDVTTILAWQRPAVGVVRLEAETAKHVLNLKNDKFSFCKFIKGKGYTQVSSADVTHALERINLSGINVPSKENDNEPHQSDILVNTLKRRIKNIVLRFIRLLPSKWHSSIFQFIIKLKTVILFLSSRDKLHIQFKSSWDKFRNYKNRLKFSSVIKEPLFQQNLVSPFSAQDVYISMGADWNQGNLDHLYSIKKQYRLKIILFCYDLIPIKFPHLTLEWVAKIFPKYYYNIAWSADEIIAISECSKKDLEAFLDKIGTPKPKISVLKLGCEIPNQIIYSDTLEINEVINKKYIMYVSSIERRKNHETLYRAYTQLIDQGEESLPLLIFVGMEGWGVSDLMTDLRLDRRVKNHIKVLNHISDSQLNALYKHAMFTVYPSLYEGWGLPVAESLAFGKFCLASNVASIPEIAGDLIEYIEPWDVRKWAEQILWYAKNPHDLEVKEARIKAYYQPVKWKSTTSNILSSALTMLHQKNYRQNELDKVEQRILRDYDNNDS